MTLESDDVEREGRRRVAPAPEMAVTTPVLEFPLGPAQNSAFVTPRDKLFVLAHLGVPRIDQETWRFDIAGQVGTALSFRYADLADLPQTSVTTAFQCAGNPQEPARPFRVAANVEWRGVLLRALLARAGVAPSCRYLWAYGLDHGSYFGMPHQAHYVKDLPLDYVMSHEVIVATHMNGEPLSPAHGFPARIVAPGFYGTNSVKWLCRLEAADRRADGLFTRELYNDASPGAETPAPVWHIAPEALMVSPADGESISTGDKTITGWAWGYAEIVTVAVSTDGGATWGSAELAHRQAGAWQRFSCRWSPTHAGPHVLLCRATDSAGRTQPLEGARNAVHRVAVEVVP
ncbi:MAG: molybdopterin-dependent oxidoreductase [Gammaproteobacteria bacterium]